ncbi:MAG: hypothetical protein EGR23_07675 [Holdemanella biformis]|nr:hypothetical protein [Holdemanella biformis]
MPGTYTNTLYPPQVDTFMPAFVGEYFTTANDDNKSPVVYVSYSLSPYNEASKIKRVHVSLVDQKSNSNALDNPTGILVVENASDNANAQNGLYYDKNTEMYYVPIYASDLLGNSWKNNQYYKVQLRFDCVESGTTDNTDTTDNLWYKGYLEDSAKLQTYLNTNRTNFSEWSTVCLIKPILEPQIFLVDFDDSNYDPNNPKAFHRGIFPISGMCYFGPTTENRKEDETLQSYAIKVVNEDTQEQVYPSGENSPLKYIYTGMNPDSNSIYTQLNLQSFIPENSQSNIYSFQLYCTTKNQYQFKSKKYKFQIADADEQTPFNPYENGLFTAKLTDEDNGIVEIHLVNNKSLEGTVYIQRTSSVDNYLTYETLYSEKVYGKTIDITIYDNTVETYNWYKYKAQFVNKSSGLSNYYDVKNITEGYEKSEPIFPQFYDAIISRKDRQLRLQYNYKVSSMKSVVNRSKIDTLGGKYPKFAENAQMNYKQFSISGLISAQADENRLFLKEKDYFGADDTGLYNDYKIFLEREYPINLGSKTEYYPPNGNDQSLVAVSGTNGLDLMDAVRNAEARQSYNYFWEREFREEVIKWLNDGEPKLYRSMTEGIMAVMITDISLTPNQTLSRRLWDFSATVYEIADGNSLETLNDLGICDLQLAKTKYVTDNPDSDDSQYTVLQKISQLYKITITEKLVKQGLLSKSIASEFEQRYTGVLSKNQPSAYKMKNIRIYFHSAPHKYLQTSNDELVRLTENSNGNLTIDGNTEITDEDKDRVQLGYCINVTVNGKNLNILVNSKGYYQIPDNIDVTDISIETLGDVVTIDYILLYQERGKADTAASSTYVTKTIVGQESGSFALDENLGDKIRNKYTYIKHEYNQTTIESVQKMQYWKGISLDVTPYALVSIKYKTGQTADKEFTNCVVGETGVLNLLKDYPIQDIRFRGRKMMARSKDRQDYLKTWECCEDNNEITYKRVNDVKNPKYNSIYNIGNDKYIYYINGEWYQVFPDIGGASFTAKVPIEGMINYLGSVVRSEY